LRNHFKTFQIVSKDGRESRREGHGTGLLGYACSPVSAQRGWVGETLSYSLGKNDINSLPDLVGNPMKTSHQPSNWLNPAAFAIPTNAQIAAGDFFGNEGIGTSRSPGLSIFKNFAIREGTNLQFRPRARSPLPAEDPMQSGENRPPAHFEG